jgi:TPR repeat protein
MNILRVPLMSVLFLVGCREGAVTVGPATHYIPKTQRNSPAYGGPVRSSFPQSELLSPTAIARATAMASAGDVPSAALLCRHYLVVRNMTEVRKWTKVAADNGSPSAQFVHGRMFLGIENDPDRIGPGWAYIKRAAAQGYPRAISELKKSAN